MRVILGLKCGRCGFEWKGEENEKGEVTCPQCHLKSTPSIEIEEDSCVESKQGKQ